MYRDDRHALTHEVHDLRHELDRAQRENEAMRGAMLAPMQQPPLLTKRIYETGGIELAPGWRAALSHHQLTSFPLWAVALLHFFTFGLFSLFHFGSMHDKLPSAANDDPNAGRAIGFMFIPYYNLYWVFFHTLRLTDRLNFQYALRGRAPGISRGLVIATCIIGVIPYVNILIGMPIMWLITALVTQSAVNELAAMGPGLPGQALVPTAGGWYAAPPPQQGYMPPQGGPHWQGGPPGGYAR